ncbi:sensor histidine kinase [Methanobacterium ferruginis]|uniref:sensor histidine kinase n=1 Tax=Methanobacterium ferruginis TaxID=710191 RepID=UPI002573F488|nr:ATP-binding protein [Methanobacterium ferruginis]MCC7550583.1 two-component sensor histidine kinase [Methanobacterium sp.]BDZ68419.1 two-component sensor histidine kinase [Methanobacterium ferruginis]
MVFTHVLTSFLYAIEPVYNVLNTSLNEDYFRLLMLIIVVVLVAILAERLEKIRKLNELNQKLKIQTDKLEDANQELEAFAYSVSHDLRVPLRAIDGFSRILVEDYEDKLDEEGIRLLNIVRDNTAKMGHLIDDILLLSRASRQEMKMNELDMAALAKSVYDEFQTDVEGRNIEFTVGNLPNAYGDRAMLGQVFQNLIGNAIKFTRNKNPAIIEVGGKKEGKEFVYYVQDNGAGFDMKYINKLFGLFQRLHSPEEFEGTGVGLSIVQRVIRRHGGHVWGEGKVDGGATIFFTLPKDKPKKKK